MPGAWGGPHWRRPGWVSKGAASSVHAEARHGCGARARIGCWLEAEHAWERPSRRPWAAQANVPGSWRAGHRCRGTTLGGRASTVASGTGGFRDDDHRGGSIDLGVGITDEGRMRELRTWYLLLARSGSRGEVRICVEGRSRI
jgi:hypothetical protein